MVETIFVVVIIFVVDINNANNQLSKNRIMQFPNREDFCNNHKVYGLQARICNWKDCKFNDYLENVKNRTEEGVNQIPTTVDNNKVAAVSKNSSARPYHFVQQMEDGHWQVATNVPNANELFYGDTAAGQEVQDAMGAPNFQVMQPPAYNKTKQTFINPQGQYRRPRNNNNNDYQFYTDEDGCEMMYKQPAPTLLDQMNDDCTYFGNDQQCEEYWDGYNEEDGYYEDDCWGDNNNNVYLIKQITMLLMIWMKFLMRLNLVAIQP